VSEHSTAVSVRYTAACENVSVLCDRRWSELVSTIIHCALVVNRPHQGDDVRGWGAGSGIHLGGPKDVLGGARMLDY